MISSTSSSHINVRTVFWFDFREPGLAPLAVRLEAVEQAKLSAADSDYPSAAMIKDLTRQIVAAILAARDPEPRKPDP